MKKQFLIFALLVGAATVAQAQTQRVHFGLKAGVTFAQFGGDSPIAARTRPGLSGGGLAEIALGPHWAVQPELLYTAKGSKLVYGGNIDSYQRLGYLDVPVLVKFKIPHFFVEAGPQLGVLLHANYVVEDALSSTETSNRANFQPTDLGYVLGLGVQDTNGLLLGVRYNGGLARVYADDAQPAVRNSTFHIYVGYVFDSAK